MLRTTALTRHRLAGVLNYEDARAAARRALPKSIFQYVDGGSEDELTLGWNRQAFTDLSFAPRGAVWVPDPKLATTVLGVPVSMPILTAPCGGMRLIHPDGDLGIARAAHLAETVHVSTSASGFSLEQIAEVPGPKFFQAYRFSNQEAMKSLVRRADAAGYAGLVATIDTSVGGNRERDFRNGFSYNMRINLRNVVKMTPRVIGHPGWVYRFTRDGMPFQLPNTADITPDGRPMELSALTRTGAESHSPDWDDIAWMRAHWDGPLVVKGVLTVADARRARALGADGIIVSNHGGRQLDGAPATLRALPRIVDAVGDHVEIVLDSGIRRGADVVKALALGARAVLVGRYPAFGLAVGGTAGVSHVLERMRIELIRTLQLLGCDDIHTLDASWVTDRSTRPLSETEPELVTR
ncbi:alpha-hydroxy acid oxidase [Nakamurella deserti]|uniref:alpha-hydroxy acid oxidase n=1 Tax=Nakamurella deserti TaxID=2164074 RepID=UPI001300893C|nr:alpha-hydroxy acid oxidase [Nakamurella deserti]